MDKQAADLLAHNRVHVPGICRIPGRGTGVLIAPGIILTSRTALASKQEASRRKAVFFEGGKQPPVSVDLQPYRLFFTAAFPEHLDYTVVGCDTNGIFNVKPVTLPVCQSEWVDVADGDTFLTVQHRLRGLSLEVSGEDKESDPEGNEQVKHFDEVTKVRGDFICFDVAGEFSCSGCPVFDARGHLVALQSQGIREGEGVVSRAVHIREVAKHLFANSQLGLLECAVEPRGVWATWYREASVVRLLRIMENFMQPEIVRHVMAELRQLSSKAELATEFVEAKGVPTVLGNLKHFRADEDIVACGLRTLWNISFGEDAHKKDIVAHDGIPIVIECLRKFCLSEEIAEYGSVLLFNISCLPEHVTPELCDAGVTVVLKALEKFRKSEVILKFALGVLMNVARHVKDVSMVDAIVANGGIERAVQALTERQRNEYLVEHAVLLLAALAQHPTHAANPEMGRAIPALCEALTKHSTNKTMARHGNSALWLLGLVPAHRVQIVRSGGLDVLRDTIDAVAQAL